MTTVNVTKDLTTANLLHTADGTGMSGVHLGVYNKRISSGGDRPPGTRPGYILVHAQVTSKPLYWHGRVIKPAETRLKRFYRKDPSYPGYTIPHAYTAEFWHSESDNGLAVKQGSNWRNAGSSYNLMGALASVPDPFNANDRIRLLGKLREAVAGSSFNAGIVLGESHRTLKMIGDTTHTIRDALVSLRRGNAVRAARVLLGQEKVKIRPARKGAQNEFTVDNGVRRIKLIQSDKAVASNWLALQYGWKPLLSDIYDGAVFVDHKLRNPTVHRVSATAFAGGSKQGSLYLVSLYYPSVSVAHKNISSERIVAYLKEVDTIRLSGLMDPVSVAWELVPYSFVVDWFVPIGNYLSARGLASALTGTFVTTRRHIVSARGMDSVQSDWPIDSVLNYSGNDSSYCKITRTVSTTLDIPTPEIKPLSKVASWLHAANAVALLTNLKR